MSKKDTENDDDFALFQEAVQGVKKLRQDTIIQQPKKNTKQKEI
ncbi:endonuclease SmrB, partial [Vibrio sp. Vb0937]|nr:endonuclease SmrB [Vibrio sp. Vb0937]MDW1972765.1 endonuclease SmrB [Vibrio sp. 945]MDW3636387.1 endonuclease SmrB [Vibrio sp. Vb0667]